MPPIRVRYFSSGLALLFAGSCLGIHESDPLNLSMEELLKVPVTVSSRTETEILRQPASVTIIHREDIRGAPASTLNDLLTLYVPGFFRAEDKDDTIASFRGLAPDNNTKVLLLLNGKKVNADWFWGPADSILNGIDLNYIERVEVVLGPGSVTLGQGAQLGVINVITRQFTQTEVTSSLGQHGLRQFSVGGETALWADYGINWFASRQLQEGERMANRGWGAEVREGDSDHPSVPFERRNRYGYSDATRFILQLKHQDFAIDLQHHRHKRHLYNWTKDRDRLEHRLTVAGVNWLAYASTHWEGRLKLDWQQGDYALYDHGFGVTTGGAREQRINLNTELTWHPSSSVDWVNGIEATRYRQGMDNWQGDNFIVNRLSAVNPQNNLENTWVFHDNFWAKAFYSELKVDYNDAFNFNFSARLDDHPKWGRNLSPRVSAMYRLKQSDNRWRLSYSEGFRGAPGVHYSGGFLRDGLLSEDSFSDIGSSGMTSSTTGELLTDVPKIKPEQLQSTELAFIGSFKDHWFVETVLYFNTINKIIITESTRNGTPGTFVGSDLVGDWGGMFYFSNADGELEIAGIEASMRYRTRKLEHQFSLSQSQVLSADGFDFGQKSPVAGSANDIHSNGIPEFIARYQGTWQVSDPVTIRYQHVLLGDWWAPWTNEEVSGFGWGNLSTHWVIDRDNSLRFQVHNIWNQSDLYPIRARGRDNDTPGTPTLGERRLQLIYTHSF